MRSQPMHAARVRRPAFRMIDLLAVVAVLVIALAILLPATWRARSDGTRTQCINNFKQIGLATHNYASAYRNALPALTSDLATPKYGDYNGGLFLTLVPFLEAGPLFNNGAMALPRCTWAAPVPPNSTFPPPPGAVAPFGIVPT